MTDTETGVSCNVVFFFVEVTTISSISNEFAVCAGATGISISFIKFRNF